jgi:diacylglycerol O-acyltransferase
MPTPDRLSPLDAIFLTLERDEMPMHIGSLLIFEGPPPNFDMFLEEFTNRLSEIPRYKQRALDVPFHLSNPVWVDDQHFQPGYHIRHSAVPPPGDESKLAALSARIMSNRLDLSRPLWELWFIEGLSEDRWAILNKVHHSMIDGASGEHLLEIMLETTPSGRAPTATDWTPQPAPDRNQLIKDALTDSITDPVQTAERLTNSLGVPKEFAKQAASRVVGTVRSGRILLANNEDYFVGKIGPHRHWSWLTADLDRIKVIKNRYTCTVNDVLLASVAGGYRELLLKRGEPLEPDATVRTMVPVSVREAADEAGGNQVAAVFADLPVGQPDALQRLELVHKQMDKVKKSGQALSAPTLIAAAPFVPQALIAAGTEIVARLPQHSVATVTTNVPGPQHPLFLLGRKLQAMVPFVPLGPNCQIAVAMASYNGTLSYGITADYDAIPDVDLVKDGIEDSLVELEES